MEYQVTPADSLTAEKDKDATLDFRFTVGHLMPPGDRVTGCTWAVTPAGGAAVQGSAFDSTSVMVAISGGEVGTWYAFTATWTTQSGLSDQFTFNLFIKADGETATQGSALFPNRRAAVAKLRRDRLVLAGGLITADLSDDFLWSKLMSAEAHIAHSLRVPLAPTRFFPHPPTVDQVAELGGKPWGVDPAYDYDPANFYGDRWGMILTRQKPIVEVIGMKFVYPSPIQTILDVPAGWIRVDRKYGHVQLVPTGANFQTLLGGLFLSNLAGGRQLPFVVELSYVAGLTNVESEYPDLIDATMKLAVTGIIEDSFVPQSGSISADGLSQSMSVDVAKYHENVDRILNGSGSNGGLMARIHGIRGVVL